MTGLMGVAMVGMLVGQLAMSAGERKHRMGGDRRDYLRYLSLQRKRVRKSIDQQREATAWRHPHPSALWSVAQIATFHAPEQVVIALCLSDEAVGAWEWVKWLPHVQHPTAQDAAGSVRLVAESMDAVKRLLGEGFLARPRWEQGATPSRDEPSIPGSNPGASAPDQHIRTAMHASRQPVLVQGCDTRARGDNGFFFLAAVLRALRTVAWTRSSRAGVIGRGRRRRAACGRRSISERGGLGRPSCRMAV
jgi:DNA segregation ATPase FtsK/SpoIIIE-like protein